MNTKDIIREIDPDYGKCYWCRRLLHMSKLHKTTTGRITCTDIEDCDTNIRRFNNEHERTNTCKQGNKIRASCSRVGNNQMHR